VAILARVAKSDTNGQVRREAVSALGSIDTPAAKKALRDLLNDSND
jgi:HEAT repeat protein